MLPKSELDARYKKLFERFKSAMRLRHYSIRTERAYEQWIRRFLSFHKNKAVEKIGAGKFNDFKDLHNRDFAVFGIMQITEC